MMKKFFIVLIFSVFYCLLGYSQPSNSVQRATIWFDSEERIQNQSKSKNSLQKSASTEDSVVLLNFHSVTSFTEAVIPLKMPHDISRSSRLTVVVVFHSADTLTEHGIWSVFRDGKQQTGLTDKRLLRQNSEYVYPVKRRGIPLINTSMQAFSKIGGKADSNHFELGSALLPDSTFSTFSGAIAECLVFDRFLKRQEALKFETYLAIKYGITLIESDYISSSDIVLWNYEENKEFSNGIAGLGRDSVFGLHQKQGSSSEEDGLLTIFVGDLSLKNQYNTYQLKEKNYLIWGHNEGLLSYEDTSCEVPYPMLERKWLIQSTYTDKKAIFPTTVKFRLSDTSRLCYLTIDRSGTGDFSSPSTAYIAPNRIDSAGYAYFSDVLWDTDGSGKDVFTFSYSIVLETEATPSCPNVPTGTLSVQVCGEEAPFDYLLIKDSTRQQLTYQGNRNYLFEKLAVGTYLLRVRDVSNNEVYKQVEISELSSSASDSAGCDFLTEIIKEQKSMDSSPAVQDPLNEDFASEIQYNLYPNPSTGAFTLEADFPENTFVKVRIFDVYGKQIEQLKDEGKNRYVFKSALLIPGYYLIEIESLYEKKSLKQAIVR